MRSRQFFYAVALTVLFAIDSSGDLLNRHTQPVWIWGLFGLILAFPIWRWKFYRLITHRNYYGTVTKAMTKRVMGKKDGDDNSVYMGMSSEYTSIDNYHLKVETQKGRTYNFSFYRQSARIAMDYYQKGDRVFYPMFASFPINMDRVPTHGFCICCGDLSDGRSSECSKCRVPFLTADIQVPKENI